jgi:hypothetical protein
MTTCDLTAYIERFAHGAEVRYWYVATSDRSWPASGTAWRELGDVDRFVDSLVDGSYRGIEHVGTVTIHELASTWSN